jgi:hypothetical protein
MKNTTRALVLLVLAASSCSKRREAPLADVRSTSSASGTPQAPSRPPGRPVSFGYKCAWLALRGVEPQKVVRALPLQKVRQSGWSEGVQAAYEGKVFVSPSLEGWVFVVSTALPDASARGGDRISPFIARLSRELSALVLYFGTHRVVEYHAWARAEGGKVLRAFAYLGEQGQTILDVGTKTPEEAQLARQGAPNEEAVMRLAGKWSLGPGGFDAKNLDTGTGYLGELPR